MTQEEKDDLQTFYCDAAHQHTVLSGLFSVLTNEEWDAFTDRAGTAARELVERMVDEEFARRETESELAREEEELEIAR